MSLIPPLSLLLLLEACYSRVVSIALIARIRDDWID